LIRRVYINGFYPYDIDLNISEDLWLNNLKMKLMRHMSQFGEVVDVFAKVKPEKINIYVDFMDKQTPLDLISNDFEYHDENIDGYQAKMLFQHRLIVLIRTAKIIEQA
jgi:hypothetical protein